MKPRISWDRRSTAGPAPSLCDPATNYCEFRCVALSPEGASCEHGDQCESDNCVNGVCRAIPLGYGEACGFDYQCESGFCNFEITRYCDALPLQNGKVCNGDEQCESGVCSARTCVAGLGEGMDCSVVDAAPCARDLYCASHDGIATCEHVLEPGAPCEGDEQCRGACALRFGQAMCDDTPAFGTVVCDGP